MKPHSCELGVDTIKIIHDLRRRDGLVGRQFCANKICEGPALVDGKHPPALVHNVLSLPFAIYGPKGVEYPRLCTVCWMAIYVENVARSGLRGQ